MGGVGRPKKHGEGIKVFSFLLPREKLYLIEVLDELKKIKSLSRSEIIVKALEEYVERHIPSNPQTTLLQFAEKGEKSLGLLASIVRQRLKEKAINLGGSISWKDIMGELGDLRDGKLRLYVAEKIKEWLERRGVKVYE